MSDRTAQPAARKRRRKFRRGARGMTLLELAIASAAIAGVLTVFVGVSESLVGDSANDQTLAVLRTLNVALNRYHREHHTWPSATEPRQIDSPMGRCLAALRLSAATERLVADMPGLSITSHHWWTVNDGFGHPMVYVDPADPDPVNQRWVRRFQHSPKSRPFVASAGADGKWGDLSSDRPEDRTPVMDNRYSFELEPVP